MEVWIGGKRPVDAQTKVDLLFRSGVLKKARTAGFYRWTHAKGKKGLVSGLDIVAYKPSVFRTGGKMNKKEIESLGSAIRGGINSHDLIEHIFMLCPAVEKRATKGDSSERRDEWVLIEVNRRMAEIDPYAAQIKCGKAHDDNYSRLFKEVTEEAFGKWCDGDFD
jgi:hypothetical protein